jgi:hypothetical protein
VGNEMNACNEWHCSAPSTTLLNSSEMASEVASFARDVADALAPQRHGSPLHPRWPAGRLQLAHTPISDWDASPCQCGTGQAKGGGRSGLMFLKDMLAAVPDLYSKADWLSSHAYPYSGEPFGSGRAWRGLR